MTKQSASKKKTAKNKALSVTRDNLPASQQAEVTPMVMMQMAINEGSDMATMERLWALNEKVEAANARKAFFQALASFKQSPPQVIKDMLNKQYGSDYVSIGNMVTTASEVMGEFGLTHSWSFGEGEKGEIICTCVMSHALGHQESVTIPGPIDESGKKNPLQGRKSTRTYLKLETFEAVTGMVSVSGNLDDDGNANNVPVELITEDQINALHSKIKEHELDMKAFLQWMSSELKVKKLEDIPVNFYDHVDKRINSAIRAKED